MSVLSEWFTELRDGGESENAAVAAIARRIHESPLETRRILRDVAQVRLGGGRDAERRGRPPVTRAAAADSAPVKEGTAAWRVAYREHRLGGLSDGHAVKATARQFDLRPVEVRRATRSVASDLHARGEV